MEAVTELRELRLRVMELETQVIEIRQLTVDDTLLKKTCVNGHE